MPDLLRNPVETLRTAPVHLAIMPLNFAASVLCVEEALRVNSVPTTLMEWVAAVANIAAIPYGGKVALGNISLRDRLESSLAENGFTEERFERTTIAYCSRQAARVACANYGHLDDYKKLCEKNENDQQHRMLPHF
jgi:hypothetical protein